MKKVKSHHVAASLLVIGAVFLGASAFVAVRTPAALAACASGSTLYMNPGSTTTLSGVQTLRAIVPTSAPMPSSVTFMIASPAVLQLGPSVLKGSEWDLDWDSRNVANGTYQFQAVAHYGTNTAMECPSQLVPYSVNNAPTQAPKISLSITPTGAQLAPGQSQSFAANVLYVDEFGRQGPLPAGGTIGWTTTAGSLSNANQPNTVLTAGTITGQFGLTAGAAYNGVSTHATATVKVVSATTANSGPSPTPLPVVSSSPLPPKTSDDTPLLPQLTTQQAQQLVAAAPIFSPSEPTNSKPRVAAQTLGCLEQVVGTARYTEIASGQSEPTANERLKAAKCFSGTQRIPSVLAPVAPSRISELRPESTLVSLAALKNQVVTDKAGKTSTAIIVSGTGVPNSSIFLYIFSDPMVLRAETDNQGKWSYVLQNPLAPGHHEIYAVAEKDSGNFVRTPALPVSIAAAAQGSTDGSLIIEQQWQPAQVAFAAAGAGLVIAALFLIWRIRRARKRAAAVPGPMPSPVLAPAATVPAPVAPAPAPAATPAPSAPQTPPTDAPQA
jgi:hypothetical protein